MTEKQFYKALGKRLRGRRNQLGQTQQWLADILEIPRASVSQVENGKRKLSIYEAAIAASFLYMSKEELIPELT